MRLTILSPSILILGPVLFTIALAQEALTPVPDVIGLECHSDVRHDIDATGSRWIRGESYKASANHEGFSFIPFLGSEAPRNFPTRFHLSDVVRHGATHELAESASVTRSDDRIVLDRGCVEVRYDCGLKSVEQSFVVPSLEGSGDMVLKIDVETELAVEGSSDGGFRFFGEYGGFTYGAAIAFDVDGRQCDVPASWTGKAIELAVPAEFLATAVAPIVIDPIYTVFSNSSGFADLTHPDVAYASTEDDFCIVYQEQFSGSDIDLVSVVFEPGASGTSSLEYIDLTSVSWIQPRIAWHRHSGKYLVIAQTPSAFVSGKRDVSGRFRLGSGSVEPPFVLKAATSQYSCVGADIGGTASNSPDSYFCIAYNRRDAVGRDVWAIMFNSTGNYHGAEIQLAGGALLDEKAPRVSQSAGGGSAVGEARYNIAWPVDHLQNGTRWIESTQLRHDGGFVHSPFQVTPPQSAVEYVDVRVSALAVGTHPTTSLPYYVVTYDDTPSAEADAFVALCSGDTVHSTTQLQNIEHAPRGPDQSNVVVSTSAYHFTFSYVEGGRLITTIAQPIDDQLGIRERRAALMGPSVTSGSLATASTFDSSSSFGLSLLVWHNRPGSRFELHGALSSSVLNNEVAGWQYCYGAPNSTGDYGFISVMGLRLPLAPHYLSVEALPSNATGFFLASMTQGNVPNAGGSQGTLCLGGSIGRFGIFNSGANGLAQNTLDSTAIPQPTGAVGAVAGQLWSFQCWHRDSVGGSATSNLTNAVAILFI